MEYFYIMSSVASLIGFMASLFDLYKSGFSHRGAFYFLCAFIVLTLFFWCWFFFVPENPAKNKIASRSFLVDTYINGNVYIDVVQGRIDFKSFEPLTIVLPPFRNKPVIRWTREGPVLPYDPQVLEITEDSFKVKIDNDAQLGTWTYRARGQLLRKVH